MKTFRLTGNASRRELLLTTLVAFALLVLMLWLQAGPHWSFARYALAATTLAMVALLAASVRRLHDIGRSGIWALLVLVPGLGLLALAALMAWPPAGRKKIGTGRASILGSLALVALALFGISRIFWQPYWVPAESMKPALMVGDVITVRPVSARHLHRGDVIAFRHPIAGPDHIARLIGLAGDRVQVRGGLVWLNGILLPQTASGTFEETMAPQGPLRLRPRCKGGPVGDGGTCRKTRLSETIPGDGSAPARNFDVLNIENGAYADDTGLFTVPEGHVFVLGDNRDNSMDSRFPTTVGGLGFVPVENITGRAARVLFSARGDRLWKIWTWRGDRFLKGIE